MQNITYITGDATLPVGRGAAIIVHVCNDIGGWGAGFVLAISERWPEPERCYREWHKTKTFEDTPFELGQVQFVAVRNDLVVANLIGQHGLKRQGGLPPIRYEAIEMGLRQVARKAAETGASIHMPRIGCGLAGGTWDRIEPLIIQHLSSKNLSVTVYDFSRP